MCGKGKQATRVGVKWGWGWVGWGLFKEEAGSGNMGKMWGGVLSPIHHPPNAHPPPVPPRTTTTWSLGRLGEGGGEGRVRAVEGGGATVVAGHHVTVGSRQTTEPPLPTPTQG